MELESGNDSIQDDLRQMDTCQWSLLHYLFTRPPTEQVTFIKSYFVPYVIIALLFYVMPLVVVLAKAPDMLWNNPDSGLKVGFLDDWNMILMNLVVLPVLIIFTLRERSIIPSHIGKIVEDGILSVDKTGGTSCRSWEKIYRMVNLLAQFAGVIVAVTVSLANYRTGSAEGYNGWQITGGRFNAAGWMFLAWQIPVFYWVLSIYISRGLATIAFLFSLALNFKVEVFPFHHDNCCGLKPVGQLGLRNQYLLAAAGMNLLALWVVLLKRGDPYTAGLFVGSVVVYMTFGPLVFIGPLLPFRKSMLEAKEKEQAKVAARLQSEYKRIMGGLSKNPMAKEDEEIIDRLQKLKILVNRMPVWPFDTSTLRKFLTAYMIPFLTALVSILISYLLKALGVIFAT